jgi:hypothetical protein
LPQIVDLDGSGRAELLQITWLEADRRKDPGAGYWITSLYEARDGFWRRVQGERSGYRFPVFERWLRMGPDSPPPVQVPRLPEGLSFPADYSNDPRRAISAVVAGTTNTAREGLTLTGNSTCTTAYPASIILDSPRHREIVFSQSPTTQEIARRHLPVRLAGVWSWPGFPAGECEVEALWTETDH